MKTETRDAMVKAWEMLERAEEGLGLAHTMVAVQHGGMALWTREVVCIVVPWNALGAEDGETLTVLFCGGDLWQLSEVGVYWLERGMKWLVWHRGWKAHDRGLRRWRLERVVELLRRGGAR